MAIKHGELVLVGLRELDKVVSDGTVWRQAGDLSYLSFPSLEGDDLFHAFFSRRGGVSREPFASLNLGLHVGDGAEEVLTNRRLALDVAGAPLPSLVAGQQVHGTRIHRVTRAEAGRGGRSAADAIPETDGLVTDVPGLVLASFAADCAVIVALDRRRRVIGLAHAGWRGTLGGIAAKLVEGMRDLGAEPDQIEAVINPSLGPCCMEVGGEVIKEAETKLPGLVADPAEGVFWRKLRRSGGHQGEGSKYLFNLWAVNQAILEGAGLSPVRIRVAGLCTYCGDSSLLYSYRREGGRCGRHGVLLRLA
ncbi:MAG: peptidoglycan editing factor PgeF [Firmicutes bacterium]|nr:peptidoglycan editing factor PgeF [Bacillota bacterium]